MISSRFLDKFITPEPQFPYLQHRANNIYILRLCAKYLALVSAYVKPGVTMEAIWLFFFVEAAGIMEKSTDSRQSWTQMQLKLQYSLVFWSWEDLWTSQCPNCNKKKTVAPTCWISKDYIRLQRLLAHYELGVLTVRITKGHGFWKVF